MPRRNGRRFVAVEAFHIGGHSLHRKELWLSYTSAAQPSMTCRKFLSIAGARDQNEAAKLKKEQAHKDEKEPREGKRMLNNSHTTERCLAAPKPYHQESTKAHIPKVLVCSHVPWSDLNLGQNGSTTGCLIYSIRFHAKLRELA
jgi:hypothetical protein